MKKILIFILFTLGIFADKVIETTSGEKYVLKSNGRWLTESEYERLKDLNNDFFISITNISGKRNENKSTKANARRITFNITNNGMRDYSEVVVKITLFNEDPYIKDYAPVGYTTIKNLAKGEEREIRTVVENLIGLEGRNFELEVVNVR